MRSPHWTGSLSLRAATLLFGALLLAACGRVTDPHAGGGGDASDTGGPADASGDCTAACDPNADCVGAGEEAACVCRDGYDGDGTRCTDVDECASGEAACAGNARCTNLEGSFACSCPHGSVGDGLECRTNLLFLANGAQDDTRWFSSFDVATGAIVDEPLMPEGSNDFCRCGFEYDGPISLHGSLYYFANYAQRFQVGWTPVPRPDHARRGEYGAAVAGGRLYLVGGRGPNNEHLDSIVSFDPIERRWSAPGELAPLPWRTQRAAVGAAGERLFVVGRETELNNGRTRMAVYELASGSWNELADPPFDSYGYSGVTVGERFYVHPGGGFEVWVFDMASGTWAPNPLAMPATSNFWHITAVAGELYAVGDVGQEVMIFRRNAATNGWDEVGKLPGRSIGDNYVGSSNFE